MTTIVYSIIVFLLVNLAITVLLRYYGANDGWLEYYRRIGRSGRNNG